MNSYIYTEYSKYKEMRETIAQSNSLINILIFFHFIASMHYLVNNQEERISISNETYITNLKFKKIKQKIVNEMETQKQAEI